MGRRAQRFETANVAIGDEFKPENLMLDDLNRKLDTMLKKGGWVKMCGRKANVYKLWKKIKMGRIPAKIAELCIRDHKKEFAQFDKQFALTGAL